MRLIVRGEMYGCLDRTELETLHRDEVAIVLAEAARRLRRRLAEQRPEDEWGAGLIVLEMWMEGP